jgi:hypothetical protein
MAGTLLGRIGVGGFLLVLPPDIGDPTNKSTVGPIEGPVGPSPG